MYSFNPRNTNTIVATRCAYFPVSGQCFHEGIVLLIDDASWCYGVYSLTSVTARRILEVRCLHCCPVYLSALLLFIQFILLPSMMSATNLLLYDGKEDMTSFLERFDLYLQILYLQIHGIVDPHRVGHLLTSIGADAYRSWKMLAYPNCLRTKHMTNLLMS